jgi:hypothetical protein
MAKIFFLPIIMKLASLVELAMLIIYHQGTKKFDPKVLVSDGKRVKKLILLAIL